MRVTTNLSRFDGSEVAEQEHKIYSGQYHGVRSKAAKANRMVLEDRESDKNVEVCGF